MVEIKGFRGEDAVAKADTMATEWVPGVNALGSHGRWALAEFRSVHDLQADFDSLIESEVFFSVMRQRAAVSGGGVLLALLSRTEGEPPREGDEMP